MITIVAELSSNHGGSLQAAAELVHAAARAGVDAVKLQTWTPGAMVVDRSYVLRTGPWAGQNLARLYERAHTPWEWHQQLFEAARSHGIAAFSTVFDLPALEFLEGIDCPMYKIASFELTNVRLIAAVGATKKPMILSTGMATRAEIEEAVYVAHGAGSPYITLLKCTSAYPTPAGGVNAMTMVHMKSAFSSLGCREVGLSDHTQGIAAAVTAAALGADMIEKHVCLSRKAPLLDAAFSLEPDELALMVRTCRQARLAVGQVFYGPQPEERAQLELRRSIYFVQDLAEGAIIRRDSIDIARPALGLEPRFFERVIGRQVNQAVKAGTPVTREVLETAAHATV